MKEHSSYDDFPGAQCPRCKQTGIISTDGKKYYYCPNCGWTGSELEICDFIEESAPQRQKGATQ